MTIPIDVPAFRAGDVVRATGVSHRTLKAWNEDGVIAAKTRGTGDHKKYSLRTIYRIALGHELVKCGVRPRIAIAASAAFSGKTFPEGRTYLVCLPGGVGRIVNANAISTIADILGNDSTGEQHLAAAIVDVGAVISVTNKMLQSTK